PDGQLLVWKDGKQTAKKIERLSEKEFDPYHFIPFGSHVLLNPAGSSSLLRLSENRALPIDVQGWFGPSQNTRVYETGRHLWFVGGTTGAYRVNENLECIDKNGPIFPNTFISATYVDQEKNTLIGTFGNGILVIPDGEATDLIGLPEDEKVVSITSNGLDALYFGTQNGNIYSRKNERVELIHQSRKRTIENLFYLDDESLIFADVKGVKLDLKTGNTKPIFLGSLKDVFQRDNGDYLLASNHGATVFSNQGDSLERVNGLSLRMHGIGEVAGTATIYACSSKGLIQLKNGKPSFMLMNGKPIIARDITVNGDRVYLATDATGIAVIEGDSLIENWDENSGLISNRVRQVEFADGRLFAATNKGIQVLNSDGKVLKTITRSEGLYAENIQHFEVVKDVLWVVHNHGVQAIPLNQDNSGTFQTTLQLARVTVNDSVVSPSNKGRFTHSENSFRFILQSRTLRHQTEITYQFKLSGADDSWQSSTYHQNEIEYRSLAPGKYLFEAKASCRGEESELVKYSFIVSPPFYQAWWFILGVALFAVGVISFIYRRRLIAQQTQSRQLNELNASKLTAIQSQMNPHFIFNALNSIQDLVLKGDVTNSYTYITKFADLVRRTLSYSDKDFIDFENELKLIELYLTLEKLRFKTNFEFTIDAEGVEDIQLPPMLVQPFIENALVHGLLHLEGDKKLDLKFELKENLVCTITDNGVGREKAREIKERQRASHESFSVNAIRKRFEILQRNFGGKLGFTTEDLMEDGVAKGTRVKLVIPVRRKF
ncbi:MAG: histidine kinase, partial [Flavobacteriales bacterium]